MVDLEAAIAAINEPGRLKHAQDLVAQLAPQLQQVLGTAIEEGGWFGTAHGAALREAVAAETVEDRVRAVHAVMSEETRLAMLVGVAVGLELSVELGFPPSRSQPPNPGLDNEQEDTD